MKKAIIILAILGGIAYVAKKAGANAKAQIEARKKQLEQY